MTDLVEYLNKAAAALYLAVDQVVADDLSPRLNEAATALEAQAKELAALREQITTAKKWQQWAEDERAKHEARAETAERERDQAREALKPFAEAWVWSCEFNVSVQSHIKVEDFRRAARAITGKD